MVEPRESPGFSRGGAVNKKVSGDLEVISDNAQHYRTETLAARDAAALHISGKVLRWWPLRKS